MHIKLLLKNYIFHVCVIWLSGLVFGIMLAYGAIIAPMIRGDIFMPNGSASGILLSSFIPVILTFVLIYFRKGRLLLVLLFVKAFVYGYCILLIHFLQNGQGVFLTGCNLLSSGCSSSFMLLLGFHYHRFQKNNFPIQCIIIALSLFIICVCDFCSSAFLTTFS